MVCVTWYQTIIKYSLYFMWDRNTNCDRSNTRLVRKFIWAFPYDVTGKLEWTFRPNQHFQLKLMIIEFLLNLFFVNLYLYPSIVRILTFMDRRNDIIRVPPNYLSVVHTQQRITIIPIPSKKYLLDIIPWTTFLKEINQFTSQCLIKCCSILLLRFCS